MSVEAVASSPASTRPTGAGHSSVGVARPTLFERLEHSSRVVQVSAPPGSGKTLLLRSWIEHAGLDDRAAWADVPGAETPQQFWISVLDALRRTGPGAARVRALAAAPDIDGWALVERLLLDVASLDSPIWLVIDDVHELNEPDALRQLELFVVRCPPVLKLVLIMRRDVRMGLHRLRLNGELTEIRAAQLHFRLDETRALIDGAGLHLSEAALATLHERTEGWAAGLRLAVLSLVGHPDPERFVTELSGSERTIAEYLIAEVLERQPEDVRRVLLRTSILEQVNGELADLLSGDSNGARVLRDLEQANAFVSAVDASWFRYHRLFGDLLLLELQRGEPAEVAALHGLAAQWFADRGVPLEAVRHAQAAGDWQLAFRVLCEHWIGLYLEGQTGALHELLGRFPATIPGAEAQLAALVAFERLDRGSFVEADRYLTEASEGIGSVAEDQRGRFGLLLAVLGLYLARQRGDLPAAIRAARHLLGSGDRNEVVPFGVDDDMRAFALVSLGVAERSALHLAEAEEHLTRAVALARHTGRSYLEVEALAALGLVIGTRTGSPAPEPAMRAVQLAEERGWAEVPAVAAAYLTLGATALWTARLDEAGWWLDRAERAMRAEIQPADALMLRYLRGVLFLAGGDNEAALDALTSAVGLADQLAQHRAVAVKARAVLVQALVRLDMIERAKYVLTELDDADRSTGEIRCAVAALQLAEGNPRAATAVLAPLFDGSIGMMPPRGWSVQPFLLEAIARDALDEPAASDEAVDRALDIAAAHCSVLGFAVHPAPALIERAERRPGPHSTLIRDILALTEGRPPVPHESPARLHDSLSEAELRVLRYLPTKLSAPEIADQLFVSVNTVKTHMRHVYAKLDTHRRHEAVERARLLGLLARVAPVRVPARSSGRVMPNHPRSLR